MRQFILLILLLFIFDGLAQEIVFDKTIHTFGKLTKGGNSQTSFIWTNKSNKAITLISANTSCGCDVATFTPRKTILPGERSEIRYRYDSQRIGPFTKGFTAVFDNGMSISLKVCGVIVDPAIKPDADLPKGCPCENPEAEVKTEVQPENTINSLNPLIAEQAGLNEKKKIRMAVYPNPAHDLINLGFDESLNDAELLLYDLNGRLISQEKQVTGNTFSISRGALAQGAYHLILKTNGWIKAEETLLLVDE